ncbi:MAG TPA: hypothetical protein VI457_01115 [Methylococcaceae bacterium]|nr:hypothetical protein [Methylococcaceae bacterium]
MYQAIQAVWKDGKIVPLEPLAAEENASLMIVVLSPEIGLVREDTEQSRRAAAIRAVRGKYRDALSSVDEFIARKQQEIDLEERQERGMSP